MQIAAGCDGGGTKCTVRIQAIDRGGRVVQEGQASSGPANVRSDPALALQSIQAATEQALAAADLPSETVIDSYVAALAGAGTESVQREWCEILRKTLGARHAEVIADIVVLFAAANIPDDANSIAMVVGTGSIAWARSSGGQANRAGGLGPERGDEGGGYWIGREAIRLAAKSSGRPSKLLDRVVGCFSGEDPLDLCRRVLAGNIDVNQVAMLSIYVFELAPVDDLAARIVNSARSHIVNLLTEAAVGLQSSESAPVSWIAAGGVAVNQPEWLEQIHEQCERETLFLTQPIPIREPVTGATRLAIRGLEPQSRSPQRG